MASDKTVVEVPSVVTEIDMLIRARYPILYLITHEESRLEVMLNDLAQQQGKVLFVWSATQGMRSFQAGTDTSVGQYTDPAEILNHIQTSTSSALYLLKDFHPFLEDPHVVRRLRDCAQVLKSTYKTILIASPRLNLPVELEKEVTLVDIPLPDFAELMQLFKEVCTSVSKRNAEAVKLTREEAAAMIRAAQGLTLSEAENAFARSVVHDGKITAGDIAIVLKEKEQIIRKSGTLEFFNADGNMNDVGGLKNLKIWLDQRTRAFDQKAIEFGLPPPRGVLLLGAPGCGKSLTAKAVANTWKMPLLRLDLGKIFSGLVGSSEENMRRALKVAEGVAPSILWIDEIEKGLSGNQSGSSDGGVAARVFGTFLTWMQEKTSRVFVVATANRIDALPPELLRRGRFDEIFFMDLPDQDSRADIFRIHLRKRKRLESEFDINLLAQKSDGYSGAELEHCVVEGLFAAFHEGRPLTTQDIATAIETLVPLSVTYADELNRLREWAKTRARSADGARVKTAVGRTPHRIEVLE